MDKPVPFGTFVWLGPGPVTLANLMVAADASPVESGVNAPTATSGSGTNGKLSVAESGGGAVLEGAGGGGILTPGANGFVQGGKAISFGGAGGTEEGGTYNCGFGRGSGSFNGGINQVNIPGVGTGNGQVTISFGLCNR